MIALLHFATLIIATMFTVAVAAALNWLFLQAAFVLIQPATARKVTVRVELARGAAQLARACASNR